MTLAPQPRTQAHQRTFERNAELSAQVRELESERASLLRRLQEAQNKAADSLRLQYLLHKIAEDFQFNVSDVLGDYEGDDNDQYLETARMAIDDAIKQDGFEEF